MATQQTLMQNLCHLLHSTSKQSMQMFKSMLTLCNYAFDDSDIHSTILGKLPLNACYYAITTVIKNNTLSNHQLPLISS